MSLSFEIPNKTLRKFCHSYFRYSSFSFSIFHMFELLLLFINAAIPDSVEEKPAEGGSINRGNKKLLKCSSFYSTCNRAWIIKSNNLAFFRCCSGSSCHREEDISNQSMGRKWEVKSRKQVRVFLNRNLFFFPELWSLFCRITIDEVMTMNYKCFAKNKIWRKDTKSGTS